VIEAVRSWQGGPLKSYIHDVPGGDGEGRDEGHVQHKEIMGVGVTLEGGDAGLCLGCAADGASSGCLVPGVTESREG